MKASKLQICLLLVLVIIGMGASGCLENDSDGDGYSDNEDDFPNDARYHQDSDGDGYANEVDELASNPGYHSLYDYYSETIVGTWFYEDKTGSVEGALFRFYADKTLYVTVCEDLHQTSDGTYQWTTVEEEGGRYRIDRDTYDLIVTSSDGEAEPPTTIFSMDKYYLVIGNGDEKMKLERLGT